MKITVKDIIQIHKRVARETIHTVKPMVTTDKKKKQSKESCRKFRY